MRSDEQYSEKDYGVSDGNSFGGSGSGGLFQYYDELQEHDGHSEPDDGGNRGAGGRAD